MRNYNPAKQTLHWHPAPKHSQSDTGSLRKMNEKRKDAMIAIINPIIVPMSSSIETSIPDPNPTEIDTKIFVTLRNDYKDRSKHN